MLKNSTGNIITIRNKNIKAADEKFGDFMKLTEDYLNQSAAGNPSKYKENGGEKLEKIVVNVMKEIAPSTPFNPNNIELISGHSFPDIVAERYYGVEVKTTEKDSWTSTGSSIVESTRVKDVSNIYMLFGKLGGNPIEFRCRPYESCLSNVAVTHSPRYLIDANLSKEQSFFYKLGITYDEFRIKSEKEKIQNIRNFYRSQADKSGKLEMPWWMGEESTKATLSFFGDLSWKDKRELKERIFIIFPEVFVGGYKRAALWLCNRHSLICSNIRDLFSAGGKEYKIGKFEFPEGAPKVMKSYWNLKDGIKHLLINPDDDLLDDVQDIWGLKEFDTKDLPVMWKFKVDEILTGKMEEYKKIIEL